jgi:ketosteroid isomerase-like protein
LTRQNLEIMRRANAAFNRGDRSTAFADFHEDVEWRDLQHSPDAPEHLIVGRDAVVAYWEQWGDSFEDLLGDRGVRRYG